MARDKTLAERFGRHERTLVVNGRDVQAVVQIDVGAAAAVTVTRLTATRARPQAIVLGADHGELAANGVRGSTLALWSDTAPREVEVALDAHVTTLELWNAWRVDGVEHSWIGNAGMVLQTTGSTHTVQCSDGLGGADFTDLVVQVAIV